MSVFNVPIDMEVFHLEQKWRRALNLNYASLATNGFYRKYITEVTHSPDYDYAIIYFFNKKEEKEIFHKKSIGLEMIEDFKEFRRLFEIEVISFFREVKNKLTKLEKERELRKNV